MLNRNIRCRKAVISVYYFNMTVTDSVFEPGHISVSPFLNFFLIVRCLHSFRKTDYISACFFSVGIADCTFKKKSTYREYFSFFPDFSSSAV